MPTTEQITNANSTLVASYRARLSRLPASAWSSELLGAVAPMWTAPTARCKPRDPVQSDDAPPIVVGVSMLAMDVAAPESRGATAYSSAMGDRIRARAGAPDRPSWPTGAALSVEQSIANLGDWLNWRLSRIAPGAYTDALVADLDDLSNPEAIIGDQALSFAMAAMTVPPEQIASTTYSAAIGAKQRIERP